MIGRRLERTAGQGSSWPLETSMRSIARFLVARLAGLFTDRGGWGAGGEASHHRWAPEWIPHARRECHPGHGL